MKKFTEDDVQKKMEWVAGQALIMKIPQKLMENLIAYGTEHPGDSVLTSDEFFGWQACPHCGSSAWSLYNQADCPEWEPPEDEEIDPNTMVGKCTDCEEWFTEDDLEWRYYEEYWFVHPYWAEQMELAGEDIIYTDDLPPIWGTFFSNQAIYLDAVFRRIALKLLLKEVYPYDNEEEISDEEI